MPSSAIRLGIKLSLPVPAPDRRDAFGDLEITSVQLKPDALAANLLSGNEFADIPDQGALEVMRGSLQNKGFYAV